MTGRHTVQRRDPAAVRAEFPIAGVVNGWFFRSKEVSPGVYRVDGTDLWGRVVSRSGIDPDALLAECAADAREINQRVANEAERSSRGPR
jgi:hypothetical protein